MGQVLDIGQFTLPAGYTPVEYIQNPGDAYIQTSLSGAMTWEITAQEDSATKNAGIVGYSVGDVSWYGTQYNIVQWLDVGISSTEKVHIEVSFSSQIITGTVDDIPFAKTGTATPINTYCLFNLPTAHSFPFVGKAFGPVKATNSQDELVFNGIPCKNSSNVAGLYDTVSGTFFKSSTSTNFTAGPELPNNVAEKLQFIYDSLEDVRDELQACYSGFGEESIETLADDVNAMNVNSTLDDIIYGSNTLQG